MPVTISPQGNPATTAELNARYGGPAVLPNSPEAKAKYPLYLDDLLVTGKDGIGKPLTQQLRGRVKSAQVSLTIEGASTITVAFADPDRGVLHSPVLSTGLPSVSQVALDLLNDINTIGLVNPNDPQTANKVGGSTFNQQVPTGPAATSEAEKNKQLVVQIGVNRKVPREAVIIAVMTLLDESGGVNVLTPDSNGSSGIFQQTPSQGWGSRAQVNDPVYATNTFYDRLLAEPGWQNMLPWAAAQSVQRSAWTGHPNSNNGHSSEYGGNYHLKYDEALQVVQGYRPNVSSTLKTAISDASTHKAVPQAHAASATITYRGVDYTLVRIDTADSTTTLTFEDAMINQLRRNRNPYTSGGPTSVPLFINNLLAQDGFSFHFVQQGEVISRVDPTGALDAGLSDPATLANFDQLLATDGKRGTGTLRILTKFASTTTSAAADPTGGGDGVVSVDGVVQDTWTTITSLTNPLRWLAMSDGQDFYIGSEPYVAHFLNKPPILIKEHTNGVGWLNGEFDLGTLTSNQLSFQMFEPFVGVAGQRVIVDADMGLLSGIWMIHTITYSAFSSQTTVTCQRIQADLEDAEHQAATDALLMGGGGVTTTNAGVLAGSKPVIQGQASQNGWPAGSVLVADIQTYTIPGTLISVQLNRKSAPLLLYVAERFHKEVEPLVPGQCGGYDFRKNVNNLTVWSNHASGTAIDLNWSMHPNGSPTSRTFTPEKIAAVHNIVKTLAGAVRWGGDYRSTVDSMHFEINTDYAGVDSALSIIGYQDITGGPGPRGGN